MVAILDFKMAAKDTQLEMCPVNFVDLKHVCLDTNIVFLLYSKADM